MSQLVVTDDGIRATADAKEFGFRISLTNFKISVGPSGFETLQSDSGTFVGTNDGMPKDAAGESWVRYEGEISLCRVLTDGSVELHCRIPPGFPAPGETWSLTGIGIYLDNGRLFAKGEMVPAYPKQSEYGVEIRAVAVLTQLCDVINVTIGSDANLPSTVVRNLEPPRTSEHNAIVVLDQNNNEDRSTSPSLALQYGPGNEGWGYVGYKRIFNGACDDFITASAFRMNPAECGFWLLDGELCIVQIVADTLGNEVTPGEGASRRMRYNVAGNLFTELDGKPFDLQEGVNTPIIAIWRDPTWMLSKYGETADIEVRSKEFSAQAGDYFFDLDEPVVGTSIVHINTVHQTDSYYISADGLQVVLYQPLERAVKIFVKYIAIVDTQPARAIKFKRVTVIPTGASTYDIASHVSNLVAVEDPMPLIYGDSVFQHDVDYDPVYKVLNFGQPVNASQTEWIETVFFERHRAYGFPVLEKFQYPGGKRFYRSPLPIADVDHVMVFVGQVYQPLSAFTLSNEDAHTVVLTENAPETAPVTLIVSSIIGSRRNVPLMSEYEALREYVFCKLGRPDDRKYLIKNTYGETANITLPEQMGQVEEALYVFARNVAQTTSIVANEDLTALTLDGDVSPEGVRVVQLLDRAYDQQLWDLDRRYYTTNSEDRLFELPHRCKDRANLIVLLGSVLQTNSFTLVNRGKAILFDTNLPAGLLLSITQPHNKSGVNGPFLFRDHQFRSTGGKVYQMDVEVDDFEALIVFAGRVPQDDYVLSADGRTITFADNIPAGLDVLAKSLHHRCYQANVNF